jgi:hypothetical protein
MTPFCLHRLVPRVARRVRSGRVRGWNEQEEDKKAKENDPTWHHGIYAIAFAWLLRRYR